MCHTLFNTYQQRNFSSAFQKYTNVHVAEKKKDLHNHENLSLIV